MFGGEPNEQDLYHSIATVGTLLLEIGEVGKKFYLQKEEQLSSSCDASTASDSGSLAQSSIPEVKEDIPLAEDKTESSNEIADNNVNKSGGAGDTSVEEVTTKLEELELGNENEKGPNEEVLENEVKSDPASDQSTVEDGSVASFVRHSERTVSTCSSKVDVDWSISFEQFLASMLTESALVKYFEKPIDLRETIDKTRNRRLLMRQQSAPFEFINAPKTT